MKSFLILLMFLSINKWDVWHSQLNQQQIECLASEFAIYITDMGKVNMSVISAANVQKVANAIHQVKQKILVKKEWERE
jgi:hypothetical protein